MNKKNVYKNYKYLLILSLILLFCVNWIYNAHYFHSPRVLYSDELDGYLKLVTDNNTSLWDKIWGNEVIRPIPRLINILVFYFCGDNYTAINWILLLNNFLISMIVFFVSFSLQIKKNYSINIIIALCTATLYTVSEFMQCQIFSILGIMEGLAQACTLLVLFFCIRYIQSQTLLYYRIAILFWGIALFTHERYISLVGVLICTEFLTNTELRVKIKKSVVVLLLVFSYLVLRIAVLQGNTLRGTDGNNIGEIFSPYIILKLCVKQIAYILGINAGPPDRNGINFRDVPHGINFFIIISIIIVGYLLICGIKSLHKFWNVNSTYIKTIAISIVTIGCCILASSTTGEIALRFVYVSFSIFIILLSYILSIMLSFEHYNRSNHLYFLGICYVFCMIIIHSYYRTQIDKVLFYNQEMLAESLYDVTVDNYGKELPTKKIIIIENSKYLNVSKCKNFLTPYYGKENWDIVLVDSYYTAQLEIDNILKEYIVLLEDYEKKAYYDITQLYK